MRVDSVLLLGAALLSSSSAADVPRRFGNNLLPRYIASANSSNPSTSLTSVVASTSSSLQFDASISTNPIPSYLDSTERRSQHSTQSDPTSSSTISSTIPTSTSISTSETLTRHFVPSADFSTLETTYSSSTFSSQIPPGSSSSHHNLTQSTIINNSSTLSTSSQDRLTHTTTSTTTPSPTWLTSRSRKNGAHRTKSPGGQPQAITPNETVTASGRCTPRPSNKAVTIFSVVHTTTITYYGNSSQYTPPFKPLTVPNYCSDTEEPSALTHSFGFMHPPVGGTSESATAAHRTKTPSPVFITSKASPLPAPEVPFFSSIITFVTTDKNPSVVFSPSPAPNFSQSWKLPPGAGPGNGNHQTVPHQGGGGGGGINDPEPVQNQPPQPSFSVTAGRSQVIINHSTFNNLGPGMTTVVTVDGGTFTILPTAVQGEGITFTKPVPQGPDVAIPTPTQRQLGGAALSVSGSLAIIDGHTLTMGPGGFETIIDGNSVSIGPGTVLVNGQALTFDTTGAPQATDVVVAGGELLTAAGQSIIVVHSTTFTYGPNLPRVTEVVDDDTITIGPSGALVHGTMLGGLGVDKTETDFEIVGGATISKIVPSLVVINGVTFTVGPGAHMKTTVIGGQTITIGPSGVVVSTLTIPYPFGTSVTTTFTPSGTWMNDFPIETSSPNDEEDAAGIVRPDMRIGAIGICIAIGVWVLF